MSSPLETMILRSVRCVKCGAGFGQCDCWTKCACGWLYGKDETCRNPIHKPKGRKPAKPEPLEIIAMREDD